MSVSDEELDEMSRGIMPSAHSGTTYFKFMVQELGLARKAMDDFFQLVGESKGVYGLHLNGDVCRWDELLADGHMSEWLGSCDAYKAFREEA